MTTMAQSQIQLPTPHPAPSLGVTIPPSSISLPTDPNSRLRSRLALDTYSSPVNQNGSFEFDRVVKSGYLQKRTQKTKTWKSIYFVLRPNSLSIYRSDKEDKLRHKLYLADLTAVALLKDPKNKRKNVFGLFSPARNYHFQASSSHDAEEWVDLIRSHARIEEEHDELLLASPNGKRQSYLVVGRSAQAGDMARTERLGSSSPEPLEPPVPRFVGSTHRRPSQMADTAGYSGNELASHSDFSDNEIQRIQGMSIEDLAVQLPSKGTQDRPGLDRNASQLSGLNIEQDPDRVIWQGWLWFLRSKGGVKQWKNLWGVLRPRNFILYKDESEYTAQFIRPMSAIVNVVDIDPVSKTKKHCLQLITEEKSYRFCAHDEESLIHCLGAFKSLFAKRRELETRGPTGGNQPTTNAA
ncbi:PH domain-containing protein [Colletotrichum abscissum]|uniref:PH domain-containing protein n=1 Tax=Colletotrichum abscissum TaxID=1671311 RepID=A0A9Q0AWX0_9PEZI|nr:PH domain-containing protein [Colletotrichum abscissum]KAI3533537.1 PH domain-containing protein [Colletotrichum abscissum]KAK1525115.1 PH domain-containing protein [Colletotrichum abscissum]